MILGYRKAPLDSKRFPHRSQPMIGGYFRKKFLLFALTTSAGSLALFFVPLCLFLFHNYEIFKNLAFDIRPDIVTNLEQETFWLIFFAISSALLLLAVVAYVTYDITRELTQPLQKIRSHMNTVISKNLMEPFEIEETESLGDFSKNYNSLIHFFQREQRIELEQLRKIQVDPKNRDAYKAWKFLIDSYEKRLDIKRPPELVPILNGEESDGSDSERRAS